MTEGKLGSRKANTLVSVVLLTQSIHSLFVTHVSTAMVVPNRDLPKRLPLLILRDKVLLPGSSMRIAVRDDARYLEICLHLPFLTIFSLIILCFIGSLRMIDSRLLRKDTLSSVIIGIVPRGSAKEVRGILLLRSCLFSLGLIRKCTELEFHNIVRDHDLHVWWK